MCLSYWREYRSLFHVATSYAVSEPTAPRVVRHVENCLMKSNLFIYRRIYLKAKA
ncbi:hypothetical protein GPS51_16770 [Acinetobacter haemolyticus]|nr:hypothetical protein [Acinetobacter haemolyticus]NAR62081.1 hypothetical protein [Acinetobacter haemolyticus]NAR68656.1 hypothetical protein [Acinetobacter haemolyticus]NAR71809.1 hypothetical protein [Acinetobacter haemolyticus]